MRNINCPKYLKCLDKAAKFDSKLNCNKCDDLKPHKNLESPKHLESSKPTDAFGTDELNISLEEIQKVSSKNPAAVALGRLGGLRGGKTRAEKLSKEERIRIARNAAIKKWEKYRLIKNLLQSKKP